MVEDGAAKTDVWEAAKYVLAHMCTRGPSTNPVRRQSKLHAPGAPPAKANLH
jgi:hypothetical protein